MKRIILAAALLAAIPAFAQSTLSGLNNNDAAAVNAGVSLSNTYNTSPFSYGMQRQIFDTNQAHSAGTSIATPAVWRCATAGTAVAGQVVGAGFTYSGAGGESILCAADFAAAYTKSVYAMPEGEQRDTMIRIGCQAEILADAWEGSKLQCPDMTDVADRRKQRWARERNARQALGELPVAPVASAKPWQAGG